MGAGSVTSSWGRVVAAGTVLIIVYFAFDAIAGVAQALLLAFFGVLLAIVIDLPVSALARHMPRPLALLFVFLIGAGLIAGAALALVPQAAAQLALLAESLPQGLARAGMLWARVAPGEAHAWDDVRARLTAALPELARHLVPFVNATVSVITGVLVVVSIALFVVVDPHAELRWFSRLVPPRHEAAYWELAGRLGRELRQWFVATVGTLAVVATFTGVGLALVGLHSWLVLALLTFVTGFVPYLGSLVTGVIVAVVALETSPATALAAVAVFVAGQSLQGILIAPIFFKHVSRLPPGLLLTWQLVMVASFGVLGVLAAQPLLAMAAQLVEYFYIEHRLGRPRPQGV
jgi:predicted PurR-regulated permease PerM